MSKLLFDIPADENFDWQHCQLIMEISQHIFAYTILNQSKQAVCIKVFETDAPDKRELVAELEEILYDEETLRNKDVKATLIYNFPECQLIPTNYFNHNSTNELNELLYGDLNRGIVLSEKINEFSAFNVYHVPSEVQQLFQRIYSNPQYRHYYSVWLECIYREQEKQEEFISVLFYPGRILVACFREDQPVLMQSYFYEVVEDVAYYLLNICDKLKFSTGTTSIRLSGMIDESSALYSEIYKYFGQTSLESFPILSSASALNEYPPHFFSPLLKFATCVS